MALDNRNVTIATRVVETCYGYKFKSVVVRDGILLPHTFIESEDIKTKTEAMKRAEKFQRCIELLYGV